MINLYSWSGSWSKGAVYVQETEAGRYALPGVRRACNRLLAVLIQFSEQTKDLDNFTYCEKSSQS